MGKDYNSVMKNSPENEYLSKLAFLTKEANPILTTAIFIFILETLLDPADLFSLKIPLFTICWAIISIAFLFRPHRIKLPVELVVYVLLLMLIPLYSILVYQIVDGGSPFNGFDMYKAYIFISFALLLYAGKVNIVPHLSWALNIVSTMIILISTALYFQPSLFDVIYPLGLERQVFYLDDRDYGGGLVLSQVYFAVSPMLVIPIAHYFYLGRFSSKRKTRYKILMLMHVAAMLIAGSRNNMIVALLLPLSLYVFFSRKRWLSVTVFVSTICAIGLTFFNEILILLDPLEHSNSAKLALIGDYLKIFSTFPDVLIGQGLGSYHAWDAYDGKSHFVTELTYFEIIRNFGLPLGLVVIFLLFYPVIIAFFTNRHLLERHIIIAYVFYLAMCVSNPNLFSSMGVLIISMVMSNIFLLRNSYKIKGVGGCIGLGSIK